MTEEKFKEIEEKSLKLLDIYNQLNTIEEEIVKITNELPDNILHAFSTIRLYIREYTKELALELLKLYSKKHD
jgi:hypothetical protein